MSFTSKPTITTSLALDNAGDAEATVVHTFPACASTTVRVTTAGMRVMVSIDGDFVGGDSDIVVYVNDRTVQVFPSEDDEIPSLEEAMQDIPSLYGAMRQILNQRIRDERGSK